ncbi:MAG: FAD-dependent oxidoreductase [Proteobacteria bacterium]|nr:FAD-dependent oxidoreductase [Pseudomonadota bacterium]
MPIDRTLEAPVPADRSWWIDEALRSEAIQTSTSELVGERHVDVAIIGGGYTGLWTALALRERRPSLSIALIEASICGAGGSGKNGGKVHGYWSSLPGLERSIGADSALTVARAGTRAQDAIRRFATAPGRDVWWREGGNVRVSAAPAQDAKIEASISVSSRLGVADTVLRLSPEDVRSRCRSPAFRGGLFYPEGANVQPARLVRELRTAAIDAGVSIHEHTPMIGLDRGSPCRVRTPKGQLIARDVVLATNASLVAEDWACRYVTIFSSYAVMTEPAPERLASIGWNREEGLSDMRMFVHYFRKTPDGRVLMGSGSGPIGYGGRATAPHLTHDGASAGRAAAGLRRLLPDLGGIAIAKAWGGPIDVSSDRLPFFRTVSGTRIHFGCGYSGHGVNATYIGGQCLASLVLNSVDEWSTLPFCTRELPALPPEPFRYLGGSAIRWGALRCEEAEEDGRSAPAIARSLAALPALLGLRIGTR